MKNLYSVIIILCMSPLLVVGLLARFVFISALAGWDLGADLAAEASRHLQD